MTWRSIYNVARPFTSVLVYYMCFGLFVFWLWWISKPHTPPPSLADPVIESRGALTLTSEYLRGKASIDQISVDIQGGSLLALLDGYIRIDRPIIAIQTETGFWSLRAQNLELDSDHRAYLSHRAELSYALTETLAEEEDQTRLTLTSDSLEIDIQAQTILATLGCRIDWRGMAVIESQVCRADLNSGKIELDQVRNSRLPVDPAPS